MYNSPEKIGNQIRNERMKRKIAIRYIAEYSNNLLDEDQIRRLEEGYYDDINVLCICLYSLDCSIEFVDYRYARLYNIVNRFIRFKNRNKKEDSYSLRLKNKLKHKKISKYFEEFYIEDIKNSIHKILYKKMYNNLNPKEIKEFSELSLDEFIDLRDGKYTIDMYHLCRICNALKIMIFVYNKYDKNISISKIKNIIHNFLRVLFFIAFLIFIGICIYLFITKSFIISLLFFIVGRIIFYIADNLLLKTFL